MPNVKAIKYGGEHEGLARTCCYETLQNCRHTNFEIELAGLHTDASFTDLGASPDALVNCDCHSVGVLEIKYPEKYMNGLSKWEEDRNPPPPLLLTKTYKIKRNHPCFYQIQVQMLLAKRSYCDFIVWSKGKKNLTKLLYGWMQIFLFNKS